ncbi:glycosyl hydrolase family 32 [Rudaeicoccus suwonensis]|uniref:beta-fructofuranosidase n=1 Tax=Rudaeicoccus suwonensis TaxID=657409 RepID=A0A561E7B6_9MICO|nr:glycosyl hydrolase family 32 [Rudaeicoccus suwonensis]TWE11508.1 beta-fructofuranosidase [Rudaeicoccus suwonensis]
MLSFPDEWVWDFWSADDGDQFHLFFLYAPKSLGDEGRRHRAARIGHAVSTDLVSWTRLADPFGAGEPGSFDATATWTGSVVRGDDGVWRMFYTGSRFTGPEPAVANVETVAVAVSDDLITWRKQPGPVVQADPQWYETLGSSSWREEAWRDPWVFRDPSGDGWHMLVTARANHGAIDDRGVIGHAISRDLSRWEVVEPLTQPGEGFQHIEVPQVECIQGQWVLVFSCPADALAGSRATQVSDAGTWITAVSDPTKAFNLEMARPFTRHQFYSGRVLRDRSGVWCLITFENYDQSSNFVGVVTDPAPFRLELSPTTSVVDVEPLDSSSSHLIPGRIRRVQDTDFHHPTPA